MTIFSPKDSLSGCIKVNRDVCVRACVPVSDSLIVGGETASGSSRVAALRRRGAADFREKIPDPVFRSRFQILGRAPLEAAKGKEIDH